MQGGPPFACRADMFVAHGSSPQELAMKASAHSRTLTAAVGCVVVAALGACAVTTSPFSPSRATVSNRSMTSQFDVLRMQKATGGMGRLTSTADGGLFDFRYY